MAYGWCIIWIQCPETIKVRQYILAMKRQRQADPWGTLARQFSLISNHWFQKTSGFWKKTSSATSGSDMDVYRWHSHPCIQTHTRNFFYIFTYIMCVLYMACVFVLRNAWEGQRTTLPTMQVAGIELKSPGLAAHIFTHWAILQDLSPHFLPYKTTLVC